MKRVIFISCIIWVLVSLIAIPLYAESRIEAKGTVKARGNGMVSVSGSGDVEISGSGLLKASENAVVEILEGSGEQIEPEEGGTLYINFNGKAKISGNGIGVEFNGANILLRAAGHGEITLTGTGLYIMGGAIYYWNPVEKIIIIFSPSEGEENRQ